MAVKPIRLSPDDQYRRKLDIQSLITRTDRMSADLADLKAQLLALNGAFGFPDFSEFEDTPPQPEPAPGGSLSFEDADNVDVGPLLQKYADSTGVPLVGLVALIHAESGFNTHAVRPGDWPDVSAGYSQMTVQTAAGYGLGDGTQDPANVQAVLTALQDRETGIRLAATHFAACLAAADQRFPGMAGDERIVLGLRVYNAGAGYGLTDDYARKYSQNLANYRAALALAHKVLKGKGFD